MLVAGRNGKRAGTAGNLFNAGMLFNVGIAPEHEENDEGRISYAIVGVVAAVESGKISPELL